MNVKPYMRLLCSLLLIAFLLPGCSGSGEKKESRLSEEFTLERGIPEAGAEKMETIMFAPEITVAKVSSFAHDASGTSLGYILKDSDTEKLIKLIQEGDVYGNEVTKEEYQAAVKSSLSGFMIEFMDSLEQFKGGVARITCMTDKDSYYMNEIVVGGESKCYRITLPDSAIEYLNEKSEESYERSSSNPGWFDKAFNSGD